MRPQCTARPDLPASSQFNCCASLFPQQSTVDKLIRKTNLALVVGTHSWRDQFMEAITVSAGEGDIRKPTQASPVFLQPEMRSAWADSICLVSDAQWLCACWSSAKPVQRASLLYLYWTSADALGSSLGDPSFGVEPSRTPVFQDMASAGNAPAASVV